MGGVDRNPRKRNGFPVKRFLANEHFDRPTINKCDVDWSHNIVLKLRVNCCQVAAIMCDRPQTSAAVSTLPGKCQEHVVEPYHGQSIH